MELIDKVKAWRYGQTGISGLDEMRNNVKMLLILIVPFLGGWFGVQYMVLILQIPEWLGGWMLLMVLGGWVVYCVGFWAYVTTDASKYKCLPQTTCYFPDGGDRKFTFPIQQDGITERCHFDDESLGVEINLLHRYLYQSRDLDFPYVFKSLLAKIPTEQGKTFKFSSVGEFWHKGMVVETSNCEHVSFYVFGWVRENDEWKPVGTIADCSYNYSRVLNKFLNPSELIDMHEADALFLMYKGALKREDELKQYTATLEDNLLILREQQGPMTKKEFDKTLEAIRKRVHLITDTKEPRWKKILNFGFLWKFLLVIIIVWAFVHFGLGWI